MLHTLIRFPMRVRSAVKSRGVAGSARRGWFLLSTAVHEWRMGIRTEATIPWHELSDNPDSVDYEASGYATLEHALRGLKVSSSDTFLDLGCGMGRPLVVAARQPFRRVLGVELSPQLCETARRNLRRAPGLHSSWDVVCCSAEQYPIPDDVTVVYLFNPFRGETLSRVIGQLEASLSRRPRELTILYVLPVRQHDPLAELDWLQPVREQPSEGLRLVVYRAAPERTRRRGRPASAAGCQPGGRSSG